MCWHPPDFSIVLPHLGQSCVFALSQFAVSLSSRHFWSQRFTTSHGAGACTSGCKHDAQKLWLFPHVTYTGSPEPKAGRGGGGRARAPAPAAAAFAPSGAETRQHKPQPGAGHFNSVAAAMKPGRGIFSLQAISIPDARYEAYRVSSDFIREFIFPGGHLPCHSIMTKCAKAANLGAAAEFCLDIGPDYALTLRAWRRAWEANKDTIVRTLGYSFELYRTYLFYFAYCEAAFQEKVLHDFVLSWTHTGCEVS